MRSRPSIIANDEFDWENPVTRTLKVKAWGSLVLAAIFAAVGAGYSAGVGFYAFGPAALFLVSSFYLFFREASREIKIPRIRTGKRDPRHLHARK